MTSSDSEAEENWSEVAQINANDAADDTITVSIAKKVKKQGITKEMRQKQALVHQVHAVSLLNRSIRLNAEIVDNELLRCMILSIVPQSLVDKIGKPQTRSQLEQALAHVSEFVLDYFEVLESADISQLSLYSVLLAMQKGAGSASEISLIFVALLRVLQFEARLACALVCAASVPSLKAKNVKNNMKRRVSIENEAPQQAKKANKCRKTNSRVVLSDDEELFEVADQSEVDVQHQDKTASRRSSLGKSLKHPLVYWAEILCVEQQLWFGVSPFVESNFQEPEAIISGLPNVPSYIVAIESPSQFVKCVSSRYLTFDVRRKLSCIDWWNQLLSQLSAKSLHLEADDKDDKMLNKSDDGFPSSIAAFNNHPKYQLERYLKKYELLHPMGPEHVIGQIRGLDIYPRSNVQMLHTADKWISQEARVVRADEVGVKRVKSRVMPSKKGLKILEQRKNNPEDDGLVDLFGFWQTDPYEAPEIVNGIIPKNKYGNMDLFRPEMLPKGAVHITIESLAEECPFDMNSHDIRLPLLKRAAQDLGIEYAEAVVGFEYHSGRSVPSVSGIVIAEQKYQSFKVYYYDKVKTLIDKVVAEREEASLQRWKQLYRRLVIRQELQSKY